MHARRFVAGKHLTMRHPIKHVSSVLGFLEKQWFTHQVDDDSGFTKIHAGRRDARE
jgi:hypothetical protein